MTLILVAVVAVALVGLAIFYNQQRTAATSSPPIALGTPPPSMSDKGIPVGVTAEGYPFKGNPDAKVVVQNFSDFQCPFCAQFVASVEPKIEEEFIKTGRIKYVFRDFQFLDRIRQGQPNYDGESHRASLAAHCAQSQGKFWEMHDLLFANSNALETDDLRRYAEQLGLDLEAFDESMRTQAGLSRVHDDLVDAETSELDGTPTFYIGHERLFGPYDARTLIWELSESGRS